MPGALPLTGLFGKLPAHGDFVRRGLPASFCEPWDAWLQEGIAAAQSVLGEAWRASWDAAPAWRFALPAHACGPDAVAGVMLPSGDSVGRRFPLTVAAVQPGSLPADWPASWFAVLEGAARAGRDGGLDADALAAAMPPPIPDDQPPPEPGWWTAGTEAAPGLVWPLPALPPAEDFVLLLEPAA
ncbi:MAG TPA: type VI secretion system-associated protein TagF [Crenalkalicoccus sp.]|nr:type VI secretion system-associated protein TagF [Crenalkalicoccus sp.]